ncbi:hypothetical protein MNV49_001351 [Pseudohyphozyma bogoriensis]|nr:hypothetical protein MNV49_001351 [Pseudohyphozyma bogoriensis]
MSDWTSLKSKRAAKGGPIAASSSTVADTGAAAGAPAESSSRPAPSATTSDLPSTLDVRETPGRGRGLFAAQGSRFIAGSTLISTAPLVSVLDSRNLASRCSRCFRASEDFEDQRELLQCSVCKLVKYCSASCQTADWTAHKLECKALISYSAAALAGGAKGNGTTPVPDTPVRALGRVLWAMAAKGGELVKSQFDSLQSHRASLSSSQQEEYYNLSMTLSRYVGPETLAKVSGSSGAALMDLCSRFTSNSFSLTTPHLTNIGVSISPLVALINHSCSPNAVVVFPSFPSTSTTSKHMRAVAISPISPGEEVLTSYVDLVLPVEERRDDLEERYKFECTCEACETQSALREGLVDPRKAVVCGKKECEGLLALPEVVIPVVGVCAKCGTKNTIDSAAVTEAMAEGRKQLRLVESLQYSAPEDALALIRSQTLTFTSLNLSPSSYPYLPLLQTHLTLLLYHPSPHYPNLLQLSLKIHSALSRLLPPSHPSLGIASATHAKLLLAGTHSGDEEKYWRDEKLVQDMPVYNNALSLVGHTPLIRLDKIANEEGLKCNLLAKCEFFNAGGSVKDRIALRMVEQAEKDGKLIPGQSVLVEASSGNTGIGLAMVAAIKGYRCIITMPEKMSKEKENTIKALGAEIIRTPTDAPHDSPLSNIGKAKELLKEIPGAVMLDQYSNLNNPDAHYYGTAAEIVDDLASTSASNNQPSSKLCDLLVAGTGTGGTITGMARRLVESNPDVVVLGVDPRGSILARPVSLNVLAEGESDMYRVEGIGYNFIPDVLKHDVVTRWIKSDDASSFAAARRVIKTEGLLVGGSCGAALSSALKYLKSEEGAKLFGQVEGKNVVVLFADSIRNYVTSSWLSKEDGPVETAVLGVAETSQLGMDRLDSLTAEQRESLAQFQSITNTEDLEQASAPRMEQFEMDDGYVNELGIGGAMPRSGGGGPMGARVWLRRLFAVPLVLAGYPPLSWFYKAAGVVLSLIARVLHLRLTGVRPRNPFSFDHSPQLTPRAQAERWISSLEASSSRTSTLAPSIGGSGLRQRHGGERSSLPDFERTGYEAAVAKAKREFKVLVVFLGCEEHGDDEKFREMLCEGTLAEGLRREGVLCWGGDVRAAEAHEVSLTLRPYAYPFVAFIALQPTSRSSSTPKMTTISRLDGSPLSTTSANSILAHLTNVVIPRVDPYLSRLRRDEEGRRAERAIREEQDRLVAENAKRDEERVLAKRREVAERERAERERLAEASRKETEAREVERKRGLAEQWRAWRWSQLKENEFRGEGGVRAAIRLGDGRRVTRKFGGDDTVEDVFAFVECQLDPPKEGGGLATKPVGYEHEYEFTLASILPRRVLALGGGKVVDEGLGRDSSTTLFEEQGVGHVSARRVLGTWEGAAQHSHKRSSSLSLALTPIQQTAVEARHDGEAHKFGNSATTTSGGAKWGATRTKASVGGVGTVPSQATLSSTSSHERRPSVAAAQYLAKFNSEGKPDPEDEYYLSTSSEVAAEKKDESTTSGVDAQTQTPALPASLARLFPAAPNGTQQHQQAPPSAPRITQYHPPARVVGPAQHQHQLQLHGHVRPQPPRFHPASAQGGFPPPFQPYPVQPLPAPYPMPQPQIPPHAQRPPYSYFTPSPHASPFTPAQPPHIFFCPTPPSSGQHHISSTPPSYGSGITNARQYSPSPSVNASPTNTISRTRASSIVSDASTFAQFIVGSAIGGVEVGLPSPIPEESVDERAGEKAVEASGSKLVVGGLDKAAPPMNEEWVCTGCGKSPNQSFVALIPCDHVICHACLNSLINAAAHSPPRPMNCYACGKKVASFGPAFEVGTGASGDGEGMMRALQKTWSEGDAGREKSMYDGFGVGTRSNYHTAAPSMGGGVYGDFETPVKGRSRARATSRAHGRGWSESVVGSPEVIEEFSPYRNIDWGEEMEDAAFPSEIPASGKVPSHSKTFKSPVPPEVLKTLKKPQAWPIVRLDNIPWDVTASEVEQWLPDGSLPPLEDCVLAVHILCNRTDGRTLNQCYVEAVSVAAARDIVRTRDGKKLRGRTVHATISDQGELMTTIFPSWDPGFDGLEARPGALAGPLLMQTELTGLISLCKLESPHACKVVERPYFNIVSLLQKFPWHQVETYNSKQIVRLFNTSCAAIEVLNAVRSSAKVWQDILDVFVDAVHACPVFRPAQKNQFSKKSGLDQVTTGDKSPFGSLRGKHKPGRPFSFSPPSLREEYVTVNLNLADEEGSPTPSEILDLAPPAHIFVPRSRRNSLSPLTTKSKLTKAVSAPNLFSAQIAAIEKSPHRKRNAGGRTRLESISKDLGVDAAVVAAVAKHLGVQIA